MRRLWNTVLAAAMLAPATGYCQYSTYSDSSADGGQPAAAQPAPKKSRGLFGLFGSQSSNQPTDPNSPPGPGSNYKEFNDDEYNNPTSAAKPSYRIEEQIDPTERPKRNAALTVPAQAAQPGSVRQVNRQINFPRDPADDIDVLKLQVFLDYHGYSPGEIDGQWGFNTGRALLIYQQNNGMEATGQLDNRMLARLQEFPYGYLLDYTVTAEDLKGPFQTIPRSYYEQAKLKYLPYESILEYFGEKFHCSQVLLRKLNPGVDFEQLQVGQPILALNVVNGIDETRGQVSVVRISKNNKWIEAFDSEGRFMFYYPSTLGSKYDPLPLGNFEVTGVNVNPTFNYKPKLFWDVPDNEPEALIPPGPNSPVGKVWIATSRKSVGIHGTPNPENISKNTSHGCIRMTNWDAYQLSKRVKAGTKLEFVD
ncbi:MAG: L,D-transpeptidase family protein [Candidatus Sumerlaeaceae bacterium]|nr:L,D-transpeptidase family protein [Candidatus Sumerlaeaceae bacterium]